MFCCSNLLLTVRSQKILGLPTFLLLGVFCPTSILNVCRIHLHIHFCFKGILFQIYPSVYILLCALLTANYIYYLGSRSFHFFDLLSFKSIFPQSSLSSKQFGISDSDVYFFGSVFLTVFASFVVFSCMCFLLVVVRQISSVNSKLFLRLLLCLPIYFLYKYLSSKSFRFLVHFI